MMPVSSELWNGEAEAIVLASFIRYPKEYYAVNSVGLEPNDFQFKTNREIAKAVIEVVDEQGEPDVPFIVEALNFGGSEESKSVLSDLATLPVSVEQAIDAANIVKSLSTSRRVQQVGVDFIDLAKKHRTDYEGLIAEAEGRFRRLVDTLPEPERSPKPSDILHRIRTVGPQDSIPITFSPRINAATGGLRPGHLWVIGGFSSVGKSAWACNMALDALQHLGKKVAIISAEMTQEQYVIRMLSILSGVDQTSIRDGYTTSLEQAQALERAQEFLAVDNLYVYDTIYRMSNIRSEAKRLKERDGLDVLIIDFLQNIEGSSHDEVKDAREVALECQRLAKELQITVVAMSQLSNAMAQQDDAEGGRGDYYAFKGSGAIKDAADIAIMLRRKRRDQSPILSVEIKKNRHGPLTEVDCLMSLSSQRVRELERDEDYE
jgi:replicative DNA helicase